MKNGEDLKNKLKKIKLEHLIVICAIIAIAAIFFSTVGSSSQTGTDGVQEYVDALENKLSKRLSEVYGAGKVQVLISVKNEGRMEIATEKTTTSDLNGIKVDEVPVLVSGKPIILSEIYPEIVGVIIIAKGANDAKVRIALISATQTFLNITSDKIEILAMK
jgi:stage III sporulation protein AG